MDADGIFAIFGPLLATLGLVLTRVMAMFATTPIFSASNVPTIIKVSMAGSVTILVMINLGTVPELGGFSGLEMVEAVVLEAIVGGAMGVTVSVVFGAVSLTGQVVGIQMGFAIANVVDPATHQQVGVIAQVLKLMGLMLFLSFDAHLMLLQALFESFRIVSLGGANPNTPALVSEVIGQGSALFYIGLRMALPISCVVLLINVGLASIARTVPQVNIFVIGFLFTIGIGLLTVSLSLPATAHLFESVIEEAIRSSMRMVRLMR